MELNYKYRKRIFLLWSTTVLHGRRRVCRRIRRSLARNVKDLLPYLSDDFGFLLRLMVKLLSLEPDYWEIGILSMMSKLSRIQIGNMDMFTSSCGIILTQNLPKNEQKSFFANNSFTWWYFSLRIGEQIPLIMIEMKD